jgi:sigma-B regulation protein RsbU (phosphoserine phosphatase)
MEDIVYQSKKVQLNPGDLLFLYTDGVTEAFNIREELYEEERLENYLQNHLSHPIEEVVKESFREVMEFSTGVPQSDDITVLAIRYLGNS